MEKVSVIMATCNTNKKYLSESIESILNQTYENIELLIVCDGSKEEYDYLKNKYNTPKIKVYLNTENMGLPYSLNKAISFSTGEYIARMDSDDISICDRIEKQLNYMKSTGLDVCGMNAIIFGNEKGVKRLFFNTEEEIRIQLLYRASLIHPTVMAKKQIFEEYSYNESFMCSQDFELWGRIIDKYRIGLFNDIGLNYRVHGGQISSAKRDMQENNSRLIIQRNADKVSENDNIIFKCLWYLSGRETISRKNYKDFSACIDYLIKYNDQNKLFCKTELIKVMNNRFFELFIKAKILTFDLPTLKRCFHLYNFADLFITGMDKIKGIIKK